MQLLQLDRQAANKELICWWEVGSFYATNTCAATHAAAPSAVALSSTHCCMDKLRVITCLDGGQ